MFLLKSACALPNCPLSISFLRAKTHIVNPGEALKLKLLLKLEAEAPLDGVGVQLAFASKVTVQRGRFGPIMADDTHLYWTDLLLRPRRVQGLQVLVRFDECAAPGPQNVTLMAYQLVKGDVMASCLTAGTALQVRERPTFFRDSI